MAFGMTRMELERILPRSVSRSEAQQHHVISRICGMLRNKTNEQRDKEKARNRFLTRENTGTRAAGELGAGRGTRVTGTKEATFWDGPRVSQEGAESLSPTPDTDTTPSAKSLQLQMETKKQRKGTQNQQEVKQRDVSVADVTVSVCPRTPGSTLPSDGV